MHNISIKSAGVPEDALRKYLKYLDDAQLSTHDMIIARGDGIFFERYWEPFHPEFRHRMYSVTKSFVSIAVGFLWDDGALDLDRPIVEYFPEEAACVTDENVRRQTVRHMLTMTTAKTAKNWFAASHREGPDFDRVRCYFDNPSASRAPGSYFEYDSSGSFVLGALVERLSGMSLRDFLDLRLFSKLGASRTARLLHSPGFSPIPPEEGDPVIDPDSGYRFGHSWGDSALLCTPRDLLYTVRFIENGGVWEGERLLSAEYVRAATACQVSTAGTERPGCTSLSYGYQIWKTYGDSLLFNGMGSQYGIGVPSRGFTFVYNGDNQGIPDAAETIIGGFFRYIVENSADSWDDSPTACRAQSADDGFEPGIDFRLMTARGGTTAPSADSINGRKYYAACENPMGMEWVSFTFGENGTGAFRYRNEQGEAEIPFGMCRNVFFSFPEAGYSKKLGGAPSRGHFYKAAASAAWQDDGELYLKVQIIDDYFGRLEIHVTPESGGLRIKMRKTAEDFLDKFNGEFIGRE